MTKSNFSASFPRKRESRNSKLQEFIRNNWNSKKLDSRLRGNDGGAVSVFSDKFLKLKISSFPQGQKTKNRNLK
ncbi:TPA: hypothetical protein ACFN7P_001129, partial [Neisseria meningitidis]